MHRQEYGAEHNEQGEEMKQIALKKSNLLLTVILGLAGLFLWWNYGYHWLKMIRYLVLIIFLVPIAAIDFEKRIVPNKLLLAMTGIRVVLLVGDMLAYPAYRWELLVSAFAGMTIGFLVFLLAYFLSRKSIGLGDVKLIAVIGLYLGSSLIWSAMVGGLLLSGIYSCIQLIRKKVSMKDAIPLAPFLSAGTIIIILLGF